jgi:tRNA threonylcarbamoyladenosine biosynthesis protein TsaE
MKNLKIVSQNPETTRKIGQLLGELAQPGDIFLLSGDLGTGKTCLTQGIAWGLGSREYALSPTFVLMRELHGRWPLYHIDLYRLDQIQEISDLGLDDYLFGQGICVIEWAEKGLSVLPEKHLLIKIEYTGDNQRNLELHSQGLRYSKLLSSLRERCRQEALCN